MEHQWLALFLSILSICILLGILTILTKVLGLSPFTSRKLVHIGVGNWIILASLIFTSWQFLLITPAIFVVLNWISYRHQILSVMEEDDSSPGTVYYAVSLLVLCGLSWLLQDMAMAVVGILVMAYGDGLAALLGRRFGQHHWRAPHHGKSIEGTVVMFVVSWATCLLVFQVMDQQWMLVASFFLAILAALAEVVSRHGTDNLLVPLLTGAGVWFFHHITLSFWFYPGMLLALVILGFGYWKHSITLEAGLHGALVAFLLYQFGNEWVFAALLLFFILGSLVSKVGKSKEALTQKIHKRSGARGLVQVYANSGGALIMILLYQITDLSLFCNAAILVFVAALADTASSEIGILSGKDPISILTFQKMQKGLSGGITLLGLLAGLFFSFLLSLLCLKDGMLTVIVTALFGLTGSLLDSLLGAVFQAKYRLDEQLLTEKETDGTVSLALVHGYRRVNDDVVNFLSTLGVSCLYVLFSGLRLV